MRRPRLLLLALLLLLVPLALAVLRRRAPERVTREHTWPVMGTFLGVRTSAPDTARAHAALVAARRAVFRVDSLMSTWQPESEISRLNARAGTGEWQPLSPETLAVLLAAQRYAQASGGAFDITVGPLMEVWGFRTARRGRPLPAALDSARARVGYRALELDSAGARARLARAGMAVDLGAIAKGYALDLAAAAMRAAGAVSGMVDLGGNVYAFGSPEGDRAWSVGIYDPLGGGASLGTIELGAGSVATSGDYEQFFEYEGVRYSHIMDPRTGVPARGTAQVTVLAPTGIAADALSTTLFVLGPDSGRAFLRTPLGSGATALWVRDAARGTRPAPVLAGRDPARFRLD